MNFQDLTVREMKPGDHHDVVPDFYPVECIQDPGIQLEARVGRTIGIDRGASFVVLSSDRIHPIGSSK